MPADIVVDSHASKQALSDWDTSQVRNMCDDKSVNDNVFDENAGLSRAECGARTSQGRYTRPSRMATSAAMHCV